MRKLAELLVDAALSNPDILGESLREAVFIKKNKDDIGGCSTFDLLPEFKEVSFDSTLGKILLGLAMSYEGDYSPEDREEFIQDYPGLSLFTNGDLSLLYFWNGDGTLLFLNEPVQFAVINSDCKKSYGWEFIE